MSAEKYCVWQPFSSKAASCSPGLQTVEFVRGGSALHENSFSRRLAHGSVAGWAAGTVGRDGRQRWLCAPAAGGTEDGFRGWSAAPRCGNPGLGGQNTSSAFPERPVTAIACPRRGAACWAGSQVSSRLGVPSVGGEGRQTSGRVFGGKPEARHSLRCDSWLENNQ